jgi:hypothetical protein
MNPRELSTKFLHLLQAITLKSMPKKEMAHSVRLPPDFINQACTLARYIDPTCVEVTDSILAEDSHSICLNIKTLMGPFHIWALTHTQCHMTIHLELEKEKVI